MVRFNLMKIDCICGEGRIKLIFSFIDDTYKMSLNVTRIGMWLIGCVTGYPDGNLLEGS